MAYLCQMERKTDQDPVAQAAVLVAARVVVPVLALVLVLVALTVIRKRKERMEFSRK